MADNIVQSFAVPNYSGMLFNKGNTNTPLSSIIGARRKSTNHVEFVTGQEYETGGGEQPSISETASLTAPEATYIKRDQKTNVTQIFQETIYISYGKESNMGTLSGVNIAGQVANPSAELNFQAAARMQKIARDIEYTFVNGVYQKSTNDNTANRSRGMFPAITSNVVDLGGKALRIWDIAEAMASIKDSNAPIVNLALWVDAVSLFQLHADAEQNGLTIVPATREINGIKLSTILTPLGEINLYLGEFVPAGTVGLFNLGVVSPVEQPVPEKGNFFREELAKTGAGTKYQIFGQMGLDHGPEWFHGKITGINTNFVKPEQGIKVYASTPIATVDVLPEIESATIDAPVDLTTAIAAPVVTYKGIPTEAPTLAYQWLEGATPIGAFTEITGATSATYTPTGKGGKFIKVRVTASGTATGTILSNAKKMPAEPEE